MNSSYEVEKLEGVKVDTNGSSVDPSFLDVKSPAPTTYPEGGLAGWLTVFGGSMILFCTFGAVQSFGVYQDYYTVRDT